MKSKLIAVVLTLMVSGVYAQSAYTFKVLVSKGKTEVKTSDAWQLIKVGASLQANDELKIAENSYLGLMHANGKPLEIREAGSFKVSELISRLGKGASVLNKYTDFILSSQQEKKNRLSATGAVHRGAEDLIIVYLPASEKADLFGSKIGLQWAADEVPGPYEVIFTNLMEERLARFETTTNQLSVALDEGKLKDEYNIMVKVVSKTDPGKGSKNYIIKKLRSQDREKYTKAVAELKGSLEEGSALSMYIMAGFYEENYLLNDALTAYQEAIRLAPDVTLYQESYQQFLTRLGFELK